MNLAQAIAAFEADFTVSPLPYGFSDNDGVPGRVDASRAPNGEHYVTIVSGGIKEQGERVPALYTSEALAAEAWITAAWKYAEERGGKTLYWRVLPEYSEQEFVAVDQMAVMNDPEWRGSITITLGNVVSRMLITKAEPQAKRKAK